MGRIRTRLGKIVSMPVILAIRLYQVTISPLLGPRCRFEPSCSQYAIDAISSKGLLRGGWMGFLRLLKCHPFHPGGYDPPE